MAQPSIDLCEGKLVVLDEATHWVQHEESDRVNDLLIRFLLEGSSHGQDRVANAQ